MGRDSEFLQKDRLETWPPTAHLSMFQQLPAWSGFSLHPITITRKEWGGGQHSMGSTFETQTCTVTCLHIDGVTNRSTLIKHFPDEMWGEKMSVSGRTLSPALWINCRVSLLCPPLFPIYQSRKRGDPIELVISLTTMFLYRKKNNKKNQALQVNTSLETDVACPSRNSHALTKEEWVDLISFIFFSFLFLLCPRLIHSSWFLV